MLQKLNNLVKYIERIYWYKFIKQFPIVIEEQEASSFVTAYLE